MKHSHAFIIGLLCAGLSACVSAPRPVQPDTTPRWNINRQAYENAMPRDVKVKISLAEKRAWLLDKSGTVLIEMDCSPGLEEHPTPAGRFRVTEKMPVKYSNLYGQYVDDETGEVVVARAWEHKGPRPEGTVYRGIAMPYWMRLTDYGVGMHVGGFARGFCSSHGCIRCPEEPQRLIYDKARIGTPVTIVKD